MTVKKKQAGVESGGTMPTETFAESVGGSASVQEPRSDMLASGRQSSPNTPPPMESGEPKAVLLALAWSPIETLLARKEARIFVGKDAVAVFFHRTALRDGLVPTEEVLADL